MGRKKTISDADLLTAAREVFVEKGIGASTKAIAKHAGVSEGVLFQRFQTKEDLFFAAMIPPAGDLGDLLANPELSGRELFEKLTLAMTEYFRTILPSFIPLVSHPSFRFEEFAQRHPDSPLFTLRWQLVHCLMREQGAGRIGPVFPGAAALLIWSTAHSIAFFEHLGAHGGRFDPSIIQATLDTLWRALEPEPRKNPVARHQGESGG